MQDENYDFAFQVRAAIERRVNEQYERQRRINPNIDPRTVVEIQINQERQKLEKMLDLEEDPKLATVLKGLIAWLPELRRTLTGR